MTAAGVRVDAIARRFGHRWALRGVSLEAAPGTVLALMGANGSGKTTLLRILATTLRPTRGDATLFGHSLVADADRVRSLVGALQHTPGLYRDLTARENLEFARRMWAGQVAAGVDEALERVGLREVAGERAGTFSSGMARRLALGRVVMRPPRLLLLDEPFSSFDADGVRLVEELVRETAARDGVVLIASHDEARFAAVADRTLRLRAGRVAAESVEAPRLTARVGAGQ